jgi:hypothetical protein
MLSSVLITVNKNEQIMQIFENYNAATAAMFVKFGPVNGPARYYRDADFWHVGRLQMNREEYRKYKNN